MTDNRRRCIDKIQRRATEKRILAFLGNMLCFDVAVASSTLGWLPHFTGIPYDGFLAAIAVLGLVFSSFAAYRDRQR